MAVANKLVNKPVQKVETTKYMANGMQVTLTPGTVKNYLISGDKDRVSDQEVAMFINLCRFTGLNPWLREAYCIVQNEETGEISYRQGTLKLSGEILVGGYAEVFRKDRSHSFRMEVSFDEYAGKKKDGSLNSQWSKKPATMIRKVAAVQALREAFPQSFAGMYVAEEMGAAEPEYAAGDVIDPQTQPVIEEKADVQQPVPSMPQPQMDAADDFFN